MFSGQEIDTVGWSNMASVTVIANVDVKGEPTLPDCEEQWWWESSLKILICITIVTVLSYKFLLEYCCWNWSSRIIK